MTSSPQAHIPHIDFDLFMPSSERRMDDAIPTRVITPSAPVTGEAQGKVCDNSSDIFEEIASPDPLCPILNQRSTTTSPTEAYNLAEASSIAVPVSPKTRVLEFIGDL
ncbi:unnamed protein product [Arabis nemorensis]|uniref:Uncharacterized protein n=1 Tax=Arabis nemorensis TaxID=586526 RepID=A0A565BHD3_9BRAS|nr:unnamed protein product [Arabis nemorensis]